METVNKRTPSRCREWERRRRNKFNEAIAKLGEIVKGIHKTNCPAEDSEDVQYPKIEIIQKAIIYLNNYAQEKTILKAEILALQVKLDGEKEKKENVKDASTQVYVGLNKKRKDSKYVKVLMLKKNKSKDKNEIKTPPQVEAQKKLPMLLPRSSLINRKGTENTIVVLPAAPYIFPQRPLLLPPPAIVLVDQNLQPLSKASVPIVNRNHGDITKTTMVNILPISAYSHPLSATKSKKNNIKLKTDLSKKATKKVKASDNTTKETLKSNEVKTKTLTNDKETKLTKSSEGLSNENKKNDTDIPTSTCDKKVDSHKALDKDPPAQIEVQSENIQKDQITKSVNPTNMSHKISTENKGDNVPKVVDKPKYTESVVKDLVIPAVTSSATTNNNVNIKITDQTSKITQGKILIGKETITESKEKDNKLPSILPLDTSLCDNVVDGGNARLELAEEFLATSPTAAFLMSFPLVSGNRADSPAEEHNHNTTQTNTKDNQKRPELVPPPIAYFDKHTNHDNKIKPLTSKLPETCNIANKQGEQKCTANIVTKESSIITAVPKSSNAVSMTNVSTENPFLNLSVPSIITTNCTLADTTFGLDFDCNISKSMPSQSTGYASSNNFFYKSDPFGKSTIYSTSSIASSHEFNGLGLYPCAMEKYTSKNKPDYSSVDDNLMKIGSSRLTYDIDLGWSHKGLDFVSCTTTANTFNKDTILTTTSAPYTTTYNPFNPDFHTPLVSNSTKKDNSTKLTSSFADTITSFYSQPANLWTEDIPFYTNNNISKTLTSKNQNYTTFDPVHTNVNVKVNTNINVKHYETKVAEPTVESGIKTGNNVASQHIPEKYTKKSPTKMHINWMTSETRSGQNSNCNPIHSQIKENHKPTYNQPDHAVKKQDHNESNYFPISMHNFPTQTPQDEFQVWPSTRPLGTTEISIDPPPINLPTLVGDLALGPHDKNRKIDMTSRGAPHTDAQNCGNFLSVTQLMNRSNDNMTSRYPVPNIDTKSAAGKQNINHFTNDVNRKAMPQLDNHMSQPCYVFNDPKIGNNYDSMTQIPSIKSKPNIKTEKSSKTQKNNYSTEALLRGANATQKIQDVNSTKFMMPSQKYSDFSTSQESAVAQVSHFPPILDYSDNGYASQQFSGTTLYNTTTNTMSNSFYSNFMPGSSNLMSSNYASGPFTGDFMDYNQTECNYTNHKYEELKMRNNSSVFQTEKAPSTYKSSRRESATKHKLECSKKESSKKYQSKKAKTNNEVEEWNDPHLFWQNKALNKKHPNLMSEELPFPNYVGNQMPSQYQADFFNSHLMPANVQGMGHNVDRSLTSFPVTSRANFNLSTIFPEITMKVQG